MKLASHVVNKDDIDVVVFERKDCRYLFPSCGPMSETRHKQAIASSELAFTISLSSSPSVLAGDVRDEVLRK